MSEADYMDDAQHLDKWDEDNRPVATHEVVNYRNDAVFVGSRAACWAHKRQHGGFVRNITQREASCGD